MTPKHAGKHRSDQDYNKSLRVEVWPLDARRGKASSYFLTGDISLNGFYLESKTPIKLDESFNFAALIPEEFSKRKKDLLRGVAKTSHRGFDPRTKQFGLDAIVVRVVKLSADDVPERSGSAPKRKNTRPRK